MEAYFTPIKEIGGFSKPAKTASQPREGDWVCLNCNNLNFSFRKKCNRCKVQTRNLNQSSTAFYLNYYSKSYIYTQPIPSQACWHSHAPTSANSDLHSHTPTNHLSAENKENTRQKENRTPEKQQKDLPSVSPLVKKYNARQTTPMSEGSSNESVWGVVVRDFEQVLASSGRSDDNPQQRLGEDNEREQEQLQRMINSIML